MLATFAFVAPIAQAQCATCSYGCDINLAPACLPPGGYKAGFPAVLAGGKRAHGHPVIADLGLTPGHKSIVFGTAAHRLYVVKYDGTVASGFPVTLPADVESAPAVGDLDGDHIPDIVVSYGGTVDPVPGSPGGVRAYRRDGSLIWERTSSDFDGNGKADGVPSSPAIGDVDGDGAPEVAWGSHDAYIYLVRGANGAHKPGWPIFVRDTVFSSPALHDLDGDGKLEIIIGVDAHTDPTGFPAATVAGGYLHVIRWNATEFPGFPKYVDQVVITGPAVGDIDGDGHPEIVFGTGLFYPNTAHRLYALRCDGSEPPGWPVATDGQVIMSPALADLDGDGIPEVIATDDDTPPSTNHHVYAIKGNGTILWKKAPLNYFGSNPALQAGNPMVADILGDSEPEVIVATNTELSVFSATGVQLTDDGSHAAGSFSFFAPQSISTAAIGDLETDGEAIEVIAISGVNNGVNTRVHVWTPKAASTPAWGVFHQNERHTGVVPGTATCTVVKGDVDGSGVVNVTDVLYLINHLFAGGPQPKGQADADGSGQVDVSDVLYLINYLFAGGPAPA